LTSGVAIAGTSDLSAVESSAVGAIRATGGALERRASVEREVTEAGRNWTRENKADGIVKVFSGRLQGAEASDDAALESLAKRLLQSTYHATEKQALGNGVGASVLPVNRAIVAAVAGVSEGLSLTSRSKATPAVRQTISDLVALLRNPTQVKGVRAYSNKNRFNGMNFPAIRIDMDESWPIVLVLFVEPTSGQYIAFYGRSGSYDGPTM